MVEIETQKLLKLYELAINEEHYFLEQHQSRIAFYSGFVSAIVAGTIAGLFQISEWYHGIILCVGPFLMFVTSDIAIDGTYRLYQRFLEAITIRAKIEQELGLTKKSLTYTNNSDFYWKSEPLIPIRHIKSRKNCESSDDFIKKYSTKGYHYYTVRLFRTVQWLSVLLFIGLLLITLWLFFIEMKLF